MDSTHHHLHSPLPVRIGYLISPGSGGSETRDAHQINFLLEIDGVHAFIRNRNLDIPWRIARNHAQIERWGIGLSPQRIEEALLKKADVRRVQGIIRVDQFNSHVRKNQLLLRFNAFFIPPEMQNINQKNGTGDSLDGILSKISNPIFHLVERQEM
jgi:hypothetical protein